MACILIMELYCGVWYTVYVIWIEFCWWKYMERRIAGGVIVNDRSIGYVKLMLRFPVLVC